MIRPAAMIAMLFLAASPARAASLDLGGYQGNDGAITVGNGGQMVEPYFANKALLLARQGGLDIQAAAKDWIEFLLTHQQESGLFERYCLNMDGTWTWSACGATDADDAALALWLELLHEMKPASEWPAEWQQSAEKAQAQLDSLQDPATGLYHISAAMPVSLLMDNVEIYHAYQTISTRAGKTGDVQRMTDYRRKAKELAQSIQAVFWDKESQSYRISTQPRNEVAFYPDNVAQIYPLFYNLPLERGMARDRAFSNWMNEHRSDWLNAVHADFPWGLVAVAAIENGDRTNAACWQAKVEPFRYSANWNVLEEASFQRVETALARKPAPVPASCMEAA